MVWVGVVGAVVVVTCVGGVVKGAARGRWAVEVVVVVSS